MNFLKITFFIGGLYDVLLAFGILFLRNILSSSFNIENVNVPIIADALGLFLFGFGFLLIYESQTNNPDLAVGIASTFVRFSYFVFVCYYIFFLKIDFFYIILAITDLITGLLIFSGIISSISTKN